MHLIRDRKTKMRPHNTDALPLKIELYLSTLNMAALMPEALITSVFFPDLYTTFPVERTETALPPTELI